MVRLWREEEFERRERLMDGLAAPKLAAQRAEGLSKLQSTCGNHNNPTTVEMISPAELGMGRKSCL